MTRTHATPLLGAAASAGLALLVRVATAPLGSVDLPARGSSRTNATAAALRAATDSTGVRLVTRDPFRIARRPAVLAYNPLRSSQPAPPPAPRPSFVLDGIVWDGGRSPTALLEGLPGADGARVVRRGDVVGGLEVKDIRRDRVVVTGADTVWTVVVREPGK